MQASFFAGIVVQPSKLLLLSLEPFVNYSYYFNHQDWWTDANHQISQFFKCAGPIEMAIMAGVVMALGLVCMRGFQIR